MHFDVIIVGAGPGGLSCAIRLGRHGVKTLVIERNAEIGHKVCAGGITWGGLIKTVPETLIEKAFPQQYIQTRFQKVLVEEPNPIIATISRKKLGQHMAETASNSNVTILCSTSLVSINDGSIEAVDLRSKKRTTFSYKYLVGADGSSSKVRKHLGFDNKNAGIGINYQIEGQYDKMEWHLNDHYFKNGYGWIFPHKDTISIGAYIAKNQLSPTELKNRLVHWAKENHFDLENSKCSAGLISYDYQGWHFGNKFLIGDAAGLASALTGEGIYPAIISGEAVAEKIVRPETIMKSMLNLEKKQKRFGRMVEITSKNSFISSFLAEIGALGLRTKLINFKMLEMG